MGGNDKLQLALDIVFNDTNDSSSPRDHDGDAAPAAAGGEDDGAPPALLPGRERPPPLTDDASISTSTRPPISKRRKYYRRMRKEDCNWWRLYLSPEALQAYEDEPDGRLSRKFHRMFRMSYYIFKWRVLDLAVETWWQNWHEDAVDCFNKPVADLRLKLLGALCTLATAATHFFVSTRTNLSEEVHQSFSTIGLRR